MLQIPIPLIQHISSLSQHLLTFFVLCSQPAHFIRSKKSLSIISLNKFRNHLQLFSFLIFRRTSLVDIQTWPPKIMLSDQGPNVDGKLVREIQERFGIETRRSSRYHPEGDGQAERGVQTIKQTMRCLLEERGVEKMICLQSYRRSLTNLTAIQVLVWVPALEGNVLSGACVDPYVLSSSSKPVILIGSPLGNGWNKLGMPERWRVEVNSNLSESCARMKSNYKSSCSRTNIKTGNMVLLRNEPRSNGLEPCLLGPCTVTELLETNVLPVIDLRVQINDRNCTWTNTNYIMHQPRYFPFQLVCEFRRLTTVWERLTDEIESEAVSDAEIENPPRQDAQMIPFRRSSWDKRPPFRFREENSSIIRRGEMSDCCDVK